MKSGIELIAAERERQIKEEGWTPEHDDEHKNGELGRAASVYALPQAQRNFNYGKDICMAYLLWPPDWSWSWFKPSCDTTEGRIRELSKAGALIAAEIDRLNRANAQS